MTIDIKQPHDALPEIPPSDIESRAVLRQLTMSARALARMDAASQGLPDPSILINTIPLQEAQASSAIENIVTTQDELYRADALERRSDDPATREALRYRTALREASMALSAHGFSMDILRDACRTILDEDIDFRQGGDFVHLRNNQGHVVYTPPANLLVLPKLLANLEDYIQSNDADPLLKMAVAHYQFEAIHPFRDGNGRTGRIMNLLILQAGDVLHLPILYLSKYIIEHKDEYYDLLQNVTLEGEWEPWLIWILKGIEVTADETMQRIQRIQDLQRETEERIRRHVPELDKPGIHRILFQQPYCKIGHLVEAGIAKRQTASKYLQELEALGIFKGQKIGREKIYLHPALVEAVR